jgi:hypothetical protein
MVFKLSLRKTPLKGKIGTLSEAPGLKVQSTMGEFREGKGVFVGIPSLIIPGRRDILPT